MFVVNFFKLKSRALSHEPSSDCMIARAKGPVRAEASYGNFTVLSHLNLYNFCAEHFEEYLNFRKAQTR